MVIVEIDKRTLLLQYDIRIDSIFDIKHFEIRREKRKKEVNCFCINVFVDYPLNHILHFGWDWGF